MKKMIVLTLLVSVAFISCKNDKKAADAKENIVEATKEVVQIADGSYVANTETSTLNWKGFKPTGTHNGTVAIEEGNLIISEGNITGGNFTFNMNSITVLDIPADDENNGKLKGHLESGDFFSVEENPTATFKIVEVTQGENALIKGDLTIKGITKSIEFPATLTTTDSGIQLSGATFQIDRTEFDIKFKSQKFFDNLKDKFINDEFEISFKVQASK